MKNEPLCCNAFKNIIWARMQEQAAGLKTINQQHHLTSSSCIKCSRLLMAMCPVWMSVCSRSSYRFIWIFHGDFSRYVRCYHVRISHVHIGFSCHQIDFHIIASAVRICIKLTSSTGTFIVINPNMIWWVSR